MLTLETRVCKRVCKFIQLITEGGRDTIFTQETKEALKLIRFKASSRVSIALFSVKPHKMTLLADYSFFNINPLNANATKWSNTLKQFVGKLPTNCLSVFDHFVKLALKGLKIYANFF